MGDRLEGWYLCSRLDWTDAGDQHHSGEHKNRNPDAEERVTRWRRLRQDLDRWQGFRQVELAVPSYSKAV